MALRQRLTELQNEPVLESLDDIRALNCTDADGTCSVIDMSGVADVQEAGVVAPLPPSELMRLFGTDTPTLAQIEGKIDLYEDIGRGEAICVTAYQDGQPSEIYFGGLSFD